jgi:hypothetical protein
LEALGDERFEEELVTRIAIALLSLTVLFACRSSPDELTRLRVENELLREQMRVVRQNCTHYQRLEIEVEEESGEDP